MVPETFVVIPHNPRALTAKNKRKSLESVNLIKEKRYGRIKVIMFLDVSKQKKYLKEGEFIASLTVSLESLFTKLVLDSYEGIDVATFDVMGFYLQA